MIIVSLCCSIIIMKKLLRWFTLIELLIVIVIIGILAVVLIPRLTGMQDRARYAAVEKNFRDFKTAVFLAQSNTQKSLLGITSEPCSVCKCSPYLQVQGLESNNICITSRESSLHAIEIAAWMNTWDLKMETDPRGAPYLLNQNEWEPIGTGACVADTLSTAWPDGLRYGIFIDDADKTNTQKNYDNKAIGIAPNGCPWAY